MSLFHDTISFNDCPFCQRGLYQQNSQIFLEATHIHLYCNARHSSSMPKCPVSFYKSIPKQNDGYFSSIFDSNWASYINLSIYINKQKYDIEFSDGIEQISINPIHPNYLALQILMPHTLFTIDLKELKSKVATILNFS